MSEKPKRLRSQEVLPASERTRRFDFRILTSLFMAFLMVLGVSSSLVPLADAGTQVSSSNGLKLQVTATPNPAKAGDSVLLTFTIQNDSPHHAYMGTVGKLTVSPTCTVSTPSEATGWVQGGSNGWRVDPGKSATLSCTMVAKVGETTVSATLSNMYHFLDGKQVFYQASETDSTRAITASEIITVGGPGSAVTSSDGFLTVTKSASTYSLPAGGGQVTYTYTLKNNSSSYRIYEKVNGVSQGSYADDKCSAMRYGTGWSTDTYNNRWIPAGETATLTCTQNLTATTTNSFTIRDLYVYYGSGYSAYFTGSVTAKATVVVPSQADLTVAKRADKATVNVGDTVTYTVDVTNSGAVTSSTWTLTDAVPSDFTNVATSTAGCTVSGNTVTCSNQAGLAAGAKKTVTITAKAATAGTPTNTATVSDTTGESSTTNNTATAAVKINKPADLTITKAASAQSVGTGKEVKYTLTVKNTGESTSSTYTVTDPLPAGFTNVATTNSECSVSGTTVTCANLPGLAAGATKVITITATAPTTEGATTNTATITGTTGEDTSNNTSSAGVSVVPMAADYTITKTAEKSPVAVGDTVRWTVTVTNSGNDTGGNYTVTDTVPAQFRSVDAPGCTVSGQTVTCSGTGLAAGASKSYTITARAGTTLGKYTNTASVASSGEKVTTNNTGSSEVEIAAAVAGSGGKATTSDGYISLTKTARSSAFTSPYTLPAGGGSVTYTYAIKNESPTYRMYWTYNGYKYGYLVDDKCRSITSPSSGTGWTWDGYDYYIAPGATATLSCTTTDVVTTTNTATAGGFARYYGSSSYYGTTGSVSAKATVVVPASKPLVDANTLGLTAHECKATTVFDAYGAPTKLGTQTQGSTTFTDVGQTWSSTYNAIAMNPENNLIYAVSQMTSSKLPGDQNRLLVIDANGAPTDLGTLQLNPAYASTNISYGTVSGISGGNATSVTTYAQAWSTDIYGGINFGFFDDAGNYWIGNASASGSGVIYQVDLATGYVTPLAKQSAAVRSNDLSFTDGYAWGIKNQTNQMMRVDLTSGTVTTYTTGISGMPTGTYGAAWTYGNGNLGFDINSGGVYQVEIINPTTSPSFRLVATSSGPASSNNDGTACAGEPVDLEVKKTGPAKVNTGSATAWDITVTNKGPGTSSGFTVTDVIPSNFTYSNYSWAGGTCSYSSTSKTLSCVSKGTLAPNASTTIRINATSGTSNVCYTNTATVLGNEDDPFDANDSSSVQTCVGTGAAASCSAVMYGSFSTAGSIGTVVDGTTVESTISEPTSLPTTATDYYTGTSYSVYNQTSGMAVDTLDANYVYYGARSGNYFSDELFRLDLRTGKSQIMSWNSPAWDTNRMSVAPDGTIWSFANDGKLYSYNPADGQVAPTDWGVIQAPEGYGAGTTANLVFDKFNSGDIAFDGVGNMWILASSGIGTDGKAGPTYLLTVSASQLGAVRSPQATMVGKMNVPEEYWAGGYYGNYYYSSGYYRGYYNGIAFGPDGTLYASTYLDAPFGKNYLYKVDPKNGTATKLETYSTTGTATFGDLGSCALPKPELKATKAVETLTADGQPNTTGVVKPGDQLKYTITVSNSGNLAATGVEMRDLFPEGVMYVDGSTLQNSKAMSDINGRFPYGSWHEMHGTQTSFEGVVPPADKSTVTFRVKIAEDFFGGQLCNQGSVQYTSRELNGVILTDDAGVPGLEDPTCSMVKPPQDKITVEKQGVNCDVNADTCQLAGAEFAIYNTDPSAGAATAIANGITADSITEGITSATFTSTMLDINQDYWLVETKAPAGHNLLADPVGFRIEIHPETKVKSLVLLDDAHSGAVAIDSTNLRIIIKDTTPTPLPAAGGRGMFPYIGVGIALIIGAGLAYTTNSSGLRRKPKRAQA